MLQDLLSNHPDREFADYVVSGFRDGFQLSLERCPDPHPKCANLTAVQTNEVAVQELLGKEVKKGHVLGPFQEPLFPDMVFSPLNIIPKAGNPGQWRLIHDLSYPYNDQAINQCILPCNSQVKYSSIDDVIQAAIDMGPGMWAARIDIAHAFHNLPMHPEDAPLLGFTVGGKYYVNSSLPFGAASSCAIFEKVVHALEWIVQHKVLDEWLSHYLDDFPLLSPTKPSLEKFMAVFIETCNKIGLPVVEDKTLGPAQVIAYLGLLLDFA